MISTLASPIHLLHYDRFLPRSGVATPINTPSYPYIDDGLTYLRVITGWVASQPRLFANLARQTFLRVFFAPRRQRFINEPARESSPDFIFEDRSSNPCSLACCVERNFASLAILVLHERQILSWNH